MKCPLCGTEGAYIGLKKVECLNRDCKYFDESLVLKQDSTEAPKDSSPACEPDSHHFPDGGLFNPFFMPPYSNPDDSNIGSDTPDQTGHPADPNNVIDNPCSSIKQDVQGIFGNNYTTSNGNFSQTWQDMIKKVRDSEEAELFNKLMYNTIRPMISITISSSDGSSTSYSSEDYDIRYVQELNSFTITGRKELEQTSYSQCKLLNDYASKRFIDKFNKFHKLGDFI